MPSAALLQLIGPKPFTAHPPPDALPTGLPAVEALVPGLPRGTITEITGPASSGRTSLFYSVLAEATSREEACALVDTDDAFDPTSAAASGVWLHRLLWVRCGGNVEKALRVTDLLLQANGFGLVAMDFADTSSTMARRIPLASWYRFRRAVEHTRTVFVVLGQQPYARQCASLALETARRSVTWSGHLLAGVAFAVERRKPAGAGGAAFAVHAAR